MKKRADFLAANSGKRIVTATFILQMKQRSPGHPAGKPARFGFTVTKKMGNAITRNRIKRRLRMAVAQSALAHALPGHDYVLISRHKAFDCPFPDLTRDIEFAFSRIPSMKEDSSKPQFKKK